MSTEPEGRFRDLPADERQIYCLKVRAERGVDVVKALRSLLKTALRGFGLRCVSITKEEK